MSWSIFKQEMQAKMQNPNWDDVSDFADFFTKKYDECMKRGFDNTTNNTVVKGNTELMKATVIYALQLGNQAKTEVFYNQSISLLGKGAIAYWTGAEMGKVIPILPAPGTILNLGVVSNTCTNPGVWPETPIPVFPSISLNPYLDTFIFMASIHLQTISGFCNTISQYPPLAPIGPAILPWTGFTMDRQVNQPEKQELIQLENVTIPRVDTTPIEMSDFEIELSEEASMDGANINTATSRAFGKIRSNKKSNKSIYEDANSYPDPQLPPNALPIDGIEKIPNYKTKIKIPPELVLAMRKYNVGGSPLERAHFLAQCSHESGGFIYREELASGTAYEGREDLGNIKSGDGVRYKGRGYIQLTGRANYTRFGPVAGADFIGNPRIVAQIYYPDTACMFWKANKLGSKCVDSSLTTIKVITKRINGGYNGLSDRIQRFAKYWTELQRDPTLWS